MYNSRISGRKLKYYRKGKRYSQEELATRANCSRETISRLERSTIQNPSHSLIMNIIAALDINPIDLEEEENDDENK